MSSAELVRSLIVVLATVLAFLAGALQHPWWAPLVLAPVVLWAFLPLARQGCGGEPMTRAQWCLVLADRIASLYLAFAVGWVVATMLAAAPGLDSA